MMKWKTKKNYWQQDIRTFEYVKAVLQGSFIIGVVSYFFYGSFLGAFLLSPYLIRYINSWKKQAIQKKKQEFKVQFKEGMLSMSAALNVGYSAENAIREAWKDLQLLYKTDAIIVREFQYMVRQLDMHLSVERILLEFANRTCDEEVQLFATVFSMAKKSGGDMIEIIQNAVSQIGEKIDVKREIHMIMAAKRLEFRIMCAIPFAMIAYLKISFPSFMEVLYGNALGIGVMSICLLVYVLAFELGKRIIEIEV